VSLVRPPSPIVKGKKKIGGDRHFISLYKSPGKKPLSRPIKKKGSHHTPSGRRGQKEREMCLFVRPPWKRQRHFQVGGGERGREKKKKRGKEGALIFPAAPKNGKEDRHCCSFFRCRVAHHGKEKGKKASVPFPLFPFNEGKKKEKREHLYV